MLGSLALAGSWLCGLFWAVRWEFCLPYLTLSGIALIFLNLGERKGASAYSVFNKNCRALLGTLDAKALEAQFTHRDMPEEQPSKVPVCPDNRLRNKPCPCGSGRKHKKCCLRTSSQEEEDYWE